MIWEYSTNRLADSRFGPSVVETLWGLAHRTQDCLYCREPLDVLFHLDPAMPPHGDHYRQLLQPKIDSDLRHPRQSNMGGHIIKPPRSLSNTNDFHLVDASEKACPACGWWVAFRDFIRLGEQAIESHGGVAGLRQLDLTDIKAPLSEVRQYLVAKYEARKELHPRLFEETVGSVFQDLGYIVNVTAYSCDGGIDVILHGTAGDIVGVQVKRYKEKIEAHQIRELTGALVLRKLTKGIFVTTSDFSKGAHSEAEASAVSGYPIELYDAPRFLNALKIVQRQAFKRDRLSDAPFRIGALPIININTPG